jgi:hypothetical protein
MFSNAGASNCGVLPIGGGMLLGRRTWISLLVGIVASLFSIQGCSKAGKDSVVDPSPAPARFMFVQASPDAPAIDLYVDNTRVDSNFVYPGSTKYIEVSAGLRTLRVMRSGALDTLCLSQIPVTGGLSYTIFSVDSVANCYSMLLVDNLSPPATGKANLRFVHVSPNAPPVDLVVEGGITLFTDKSFKGRPDFVPIDAGTYTFDVKVAGTSTVLASARDVLLEGGKIYTLYLRGFAGSTGITAIDASILVHN